MLYQLSYVRLNGRIAALRIGDNASHHENSGGDEWLI
jgi:hypothetical protein